MFFKFGRPALGLKDKPASFFIQREVLAEIETLARAGFPREVCGFLAGKVQGQGQLVRPAENVAGFAEAEYSVRPEETLAALLELERLEFKITAVYHSHPRYPSRPSGTDLHLADMPGVFYLITSVYDNNNKRAGELSCKTTAWIIQQGKALPAELTIS